MLLLAAGLTPRLLPLDLEPDPGEQVASTLLVCFALLIGTNWALAALHCLNFEGLVVSTILAAAGGAALTMKQWKGWLSARPERPSPLILSFWIFFGLVVAYAAVRSLVIGPRVEEFDALSYHFPKAVEIMRAHTVPHVISGDFRLSYFPWNYELLLADALILTPGDGFTFLIPLAAYLGFLASVHSVFRRCWPTSPSQDLIAGLAIVAATPILILHITANKNDVLTVFLQVEFLLWFTHWCLNGDLRSMGLAFGSFVLMLGTKTSALFLGPAALFMLWHHRKAWSPPLRTSAVRPWHLAGTAVLIFFLLGGGWLVLNFRWSGNPLGACAWAGGISSFEANAAPRYTGIANLWHFPLMLFGKPFSSNELGAWAVWDGRYWFWPTYRIVYGHFGWLCSALLILLPFSRALTRGVDDSARTFRLHLSLGLISFVLFCLPQQYRVDGMFCGMPRYMLCIPLVIAIWTSVPLLGWLRRKGWPFLHGLIVLGTLAYAMAQHWIYFKRDEARPFALFVHELLNAAPREPILMSEILDRIAKPKDVVALDGGFGALFYPAYGTQLDRPLHFLKPDPKRVSIPADTKWVLIDRSWNSGWSHPGATTAADFWGPITPRPTTEDLALLAQLRRDPDWELIVINPPLVQAIFRRRAVTQT